MAKHSKLETTNPFTGEIISVWSCTRLGRAILAGDTAAIRGMFAEELEQTERHRIIGDPRRRMDALRAGAAARGNTFARAYA